MQCAPDLASDDVGVVNTDPQTYLWACPPQEDQFGEVMFAVSPNTTAAWSTTCPGENTLRMARLCKAKLECI